MNETHPLTCLSDGEERMVLSLRTGILVHGFRSTCRMGGEYVGGEL